MSLRYARARWLPGHHRWLAKLCSTGRAMGFWLAVALPLAYVPLVLSPVAVDPIVLLAALVGNLLALSVGHGHEPSFGPLAAD